MRRYLIVANQTLASDQLAEKVQDVLATGPASSHLVVPATPTHEHLTWTEGAAQEVAERNLEAAVALFSTLGAEIDGEVGAGPSPPGPPCIRSAGVARRRRIGALGAA